MYIRTEPAIRSGNPYASFAETLGEIRPVAPCPRYEQREVEISRTERGHLATDATVDSGRILVADFGVDWQKIKESTKNEPLLRQWLNAFESNPSYRLRILGYSDCVGAENNNLTLRTGRAERVHALLGRLAQTRVVSKGPAPLNTYVADNATVEGRARNRSVVIEFQQNLQFEPEDACDNRIRAVTVWLNAFIPKDIPGLTKNVPDAIDPSMRGKTMITPLGGCFLTDQRSFSTDINATSRMHSEATIDVDKRTLIDQKHRIDPTTQVACQWGAVICKATSSTAPMSFSFLGVSSANEIMVRVKGSQGPACPGKAMRTIGQVFVNTNIDYEGTFFIKRVASNYVDIGFLGTVDQFPAYEFVAAINHSNPVHLGGKLPAPGSSPITHLGAKHKVHFQRRVWLKCSNGKPVTGVIRIIN